MTLLIKSNFEIRVGNPGDPRVHELLERLSGRLAAITGRDGKDSVAYDDVASLKSVLLVASSDGRPIGCGAIRPIDDHVCEVKRMYAETSRSGIGTHILAELEKYAVRMGFSTLWLETGIENQIACNFYLRRGYKVRGNYGKYVGRSDCICFEKQI
jgi:putative acetyltransferase